MSLSRRLALRLDQQRHADFTYDDLGRIREQKAWDRTSGSDALKFTKTN